MRLIRLRRQLLRELASYALTLAVLSGCLVPNARALSPASPGAKGKEPSATSRPEAPPEAKPPARPDAPSTRREPAGRGSQEVAGEAYANVPLSFEANLGQTDASVKFLTRGSSYRLYLTQDEAVTVLKGRAAAPASPGASTPSRGAGKSPDTVVRMKFVGANPQAQVTGVEELPTRSNYIKGGDPRLWQANVPHYAKVKYEAVYPGVDVFYYGNGSQLEYDFVVAPGTDPSVIRLGFQGADRISIERSGDILLQTKGGALRHRKPFAYQEVNGERKQVEARYVPAGKLRFGIAVGEYDRGRPLIIDPVLSYSTYLGGGENDIANGLAVDAAGSAYITGSTASLDFPLTGGAQGSNGGLADAFVTKLNPAGTAVVYSTYLGGSAEDTSNGIVVDASGNVFITGSTYSSNFPTFNALQAVYGGGKDAFVAKLSSTGSALGFSTYLGAAGGEDEGKGLALDPAGNVYVTGGTSSVNFPVVNAVQPTNWSSQWLSSGTTDAFVTKLDPSGTTMVYSTFLGGADNDEGRAVAADASGRAYVTGVTHSAEFPVANALQPTLGLSGGGILSDDVFVTKLSETGSALIYSTYLGGSNNEAGNGLALDSTGSVYVAGNTGSTNFPMVAGSYRTTYRGGAGDAFVFKLAPDGASLIYSTYLGGSGQDHGKAIALDAAGNAFVAGYAGSTNFPVAGGSITAAPISNNLWAAKPFVAKIDAPGKVLLSSTFLGSNRGNFMQSDFINALALDAAGNAYAAGYTSAPDFPTTQGAVQGTYNNSDAYNNQAFVSKILDSNGLSLNGKLTDSTGTPLEDVPVTLSGTQTRTIRTNTNGDYWFGGLAGGGTYTVTPSGAKYLFTPVAQTFTNLSANQTQNFSGALKSYIISGRVTDAAGAGVVGVDINASDGSTTQTVASGNYSLILSAGSDYTLTPSKDGLVFSPLDQTFTNLSANQTANFTVGFSISGQLLDTAGNGLAYATVKLGGAATRTVQSDAFGNYSINNVAPGANYTVTPSLDGYGFAPSSKSFTNLAADQTADFTGSTYRISGHIADAGGAARPSIPVILSGTHGGYAATDANGNYSLNVAPGGTYTVTPTGNDSYTLSPASQTFANVNGDRTADFTYNSYVIQGTLTDPYGWPVVFGIVTLSGSRNTTVFTNFFGAYGFYVAPGGTYTVTPRYDATAGYAFLPSSQTFTNLSASQTANFHVGQYRISGRVTDVHGRDALYGVIQMSGSQTGSTNIHDGVYEIYVAPGATVTLTPDTGGVVLPASRTFTNVQSNQVADFSDTTNNTISGRVENITHIGLAGAVVTLSGTHSLTTQTDASGKYSFGGLSVGGNYWVSVSMPTYSFTPASQVFNNLEMGDFTANFTALKTGTYTLKPTADAYVNDGSPATSFGTATDLRARKSATGGAQNETYVTFDLSGVPGSITSAKLRLYGKSSDAGGASVPLSVYPVANTLWVDSGPQAINWNTKPTAGATASTAFTVAGSAATWYEVDVFPYVGSEKSAGRNVVSLALKGTGNTAQYATFNSREAPDGRPELIVTSAPNITSITPGSGPVGTAVTIKGINFGTQQRDSTVTFNGVAAAPSGWSDTSIAVAVPTGAGSGAVVVTVDGIAGNPVAYTVTNNGTLSGTITRVSDGATVSGAKVEALQGTVVKATVTTAAGGAYSLGNLPAGAYDLRVSATGFATNLKPGNQVNGGATTTVNVALANEGIISGKVTRAADATAVSGAAVTAYQGANVVATTTTNATGDYSFKTLAAGSYSVDASASGLTTNSQTGVAVTAGATTTVNLSLKAPTELYHLHNEASSTAGQLQLKTAGPDVASATLLSANLNGQGTGEKLVKAFDTQAGVPNAAGVIKTGSTVSFSLWMRKTAASGVMVPRAKVFLNSASGAQLCTATGPTALTATVAKYPFTCTTTANITVSASDRFYVWTGVNVTTAATASVQADLRIEGTLNGNYDSTVTVPLPTGVPNISGLSPASGPVGTFVTLTGTNFGAGQGTSTLTFNGVATTAASWNNTSIGVAVPSGALTGPVVVTVNGLASNTQTFTVASPGAVSGIIRRASDSAAVSGATVTALQMNVLKASAVTAANGSYTLNGLAPGTYDLRVTASALGTAVRAGVVVASGGTTTADVSLSAVGTAAGKVTAYDGTALSGASVVVYQGVTAVASATTNATGDYSVATLSAGSYVVEASAAGYQAKSGAASVTAGATTTVNLKLTALTVSYHLHNEASSTAGLLQLKTAGPDVASAVLLSADLNGQAPGEKLVKAFDTQAGVPNVGGVIPAGAAVTFNLWMRKTAALGTLFPRAQLFLNSLAGSPVCSVTGASALTTTVAKYTLTCTPAADVTVNASDRFYLWTGVSLSAQTAGSFKGELDVEGTLNGNYDSLLTMQMPLARPSISSVTPNAGTTGTQVTLSGANFGATQGTSTLTFNGVAAAPLSWNDTTLIVAVPSGALTGPVVVTANGLASNGPTFTVDTAPFITTLLPGYGPAGTSVTIDGFNFGPSQGTGWVNFNGVPASVSNWSAGRLVVVVPAGTTTGPVRVVAGGAESNGLLYTLTAGGAGDTDGDGLPDSWETQYFGNLNQTGAGDFDGDGVSNLSEYQQGRNPTKGLVPDNGTAINLKLYTPLEPKP